MTDESYTTTWALECKNCGHQWLKDWLLPMRASRFSLELLDEAAKGCSNCGATEGIMILEGRRYWEALAELS